MGGSDCGACIQEGQSVIMSQVINVDPSSGETLLNLVLITLVPLSVVAIWVAALVALVWCVRSIKEIQRKLRDKK